MGKRSTREVFALTCSDAFHALHLYRFSISNPELIIAMDAEEITQYIQGKLTNYLML